MDILRRNNPDTLRTAAAEGIPDNPEAVVPAPAPMGIPAVEGMEIHTLILKIKSKTKSQTLR